jgi:3-hydroxymyristoyl/3-hydroxydecanoyl-(acyl carrier protein) dehydratase
VSRLASPIALDCDQVQSLIPHRSPFLFVTRAEILSSDQINGWCRWESDNPLLAGHFPAFAIVPGVLLVEAAAQLVGSLIGYNAQQVPSRYGVNVPPEKLVGVLASIKRATFHKPVFPDESILFQVTIDPPIGPMFLAHCEAIGSAGQKICKCELSVAIAAKSGLLPNQAP